MVKIMVNHPGKFSPKRTLVNFTMVGVLKIFVLKAENMAFFVPPISAGMLAGLLAPDSDVS